MVVRRAFAQSKYTTTIYPRAHASRGSAGGRRRRDLRAGLWRRRARAPRSGRRATVRSEVQGHGGGLHRRRAQDVLVGVRVARFGVTRRRVARRRVARPGHVVRDDVQVRRDRLVGASRLPFPRRAVRRGSACARASSALAATFVRRAFDDDAANVLTVADVRAEPAAPIAGTTRLLERHRMRTGQSLRETGARDARHVRSCRRPERRADVCAAAPEFDRARRRAMHVRHGLPCHLSMRQRLGVAWKLHEVTADRALRRLRHQGPAPSRTGVARRSRRASRARGACASRRGRRHRQSRRGGARSRQH